MALRQASNLKKSTLVSGGINSSQTTIPLVTSGGAQFPATSAGEFSVLISDSRYANGYDDPNKEICNVTSHDGSSDTIATVARASGGTSAVAHNTSGITYNVTLVFTKADFDYLAEWNKDIFNIGTGPYTNKTYYPLCPPVLSGTTSSINQTLNRLTVIPFIIYQTRTLDEIVVHKFASGAGTANMRVGIYNSTSSTNHYPNALLLAPDELTEANSNGRYVFTVSYQLIPGFYWSAITTDTTVAVHGIGNGSLLAIGGWDVNVYNAVGPRNIFDVSRTYSALPDPFTASANLGANSIPLIFGHFSA